MHVSSKRNCQPYLQSHYPVWGQTCHNVDRCPILGETEKAGACAVQAGRIGGRREVLEAVGAAVSSATSQSKHTSAAKSESEPR